MPCQTNHLRSDKHPTFKSRLLPLLITLSCSPHSIASSITGTGDNIELHTIEEILVTAQKRQERLLDIPIAISVIDKESLQQRQSNTLTDIARQVPGLQISSPNGSVLPIFSIRGVSMSDYNVNQASPVGVYLDEMYLSSNYSHGLALFDLERIEVLRGPQGTLYGKNTTGGAINLISRTPGFQTDGYLRLSLGNYNQRSLDAAYESPLVDDLLAARIALHYEKSDGYAENHYPGEDDLSNTDTLAARLTLKYQPSDSFDATLRLNFGHSDPNTQAIVAVPTDPGGLDRLSSTLALFSQPFYQRPDSYNYHDTNSNKVDHTRTVTKGAALTLHKTFSNLQLTSVTGYYNGDYDHLADSDGTPQELLESDWRGDIRQWHQDLRLINLDDGPLQYTLGLYLANEQHEIHNHWHMFHGLEPVLPGFSASTGFSLDQRYQQERDSYAGYGQIEYSVSENWTLTGGLRFSKDKNRQFDVHSYIADYNDIPMAGLIPTANPYDPTARQPSQTIVDREWTGTLKLDYNLNNNLLYASYSRGYRSGAFNGSAVWAASELTPVEPEFVDAFEVGAKGQLINKQLEYTASLFHYDYKNQQFLKIEGVQQLMDSAPKARSRGLELALDGHIGNNLSIQTSLALLDTEYTDGPELTAGGASYDLTGNQLISAPEVSADLAIDYDFTWREADINFHLDLSYIGEQWFTAFNDDAGHKDIGQSGYTLFNGRLNYSWGKKQYQLSLWGRNLTNKEYQVYAINLSDSFGYHYTIKGAPRTFGASLQVQF